jgi:hypothetical protein
VICLDYVQSHLAFHSSHGGSLARTIELKFNYCQLRVTSFVRSAAPALVKYLLDV